MKTWYLLKQNPYLFQRYFIKEYVIKACRKFFEEKNYHELESPILTDSLPQERYLDPFKVSVGGKHAYLTPTTEKYNKKMLAAGLGEHFVITKVARDMENIGPNHLPEFTMLEWYHLNANYFDLMDDCEKLFQFIFGYIQVALKKEKELNRFQVKILESSSADNTKLHTPMAITYQDKSIDLSTPWPRISIPEALEKYCGVKLEAIQDVNEFRKILKDKGYNIVDEDSWQICFELLFANEIEPNLPKDKPCFVYDYPKQICVLTKANDKNPLVCEKVELYFAGKEVANGYTELLDANEQEKRFIEEQKARKSLGKPDVKFDHDLIEALKSGLPNVAGIGMGLDRVAMIFADAKSISDINYFPATDWDS